MKLLMLYNKIPTKVYEIMPSTRKVHLNAIISMEITTCQGLKSLSQIA